MVDFFKSKQNRRITQMAKPLEDVGGGGGFGFSSPLKISYTCNNCYYYYFCCSDL